MLLSYARVVVVPLLLLLFYSTVRFAGQLNTQLKSAKYANKCEIENTHTHIQRVSNVCVQHMQATV